MNNSIKKASSRTPVTVQANDSISNEEQARLQERAEFVLKHAKQCGATSAEVGARIDVGLSVTVRLSDVETLEFHREKSLGVTVYSGQRKGSASTSDLRDDALKATVQAAYDIAQFTSEDPCAGLADKELLAFNYPSLDLSHPWGLSAEQAIDLATRCENFGRQFDSRICNSEGASVSTGQGYKVYANSHGFLGAYATTSHYLSCVLVAQEGDQMQRDYDFTVSRDPISLASPQTVAENAALRTVQRLNARSLATQKAPVLFAPEIARGLLGHFIGAISGGNLYRKSSFLVDCLGKKVFPSFVNIDERPHLLKGLGSCPFDSEGVQTRDLVRVHDGILESYVLGSYSARKLGLKTTGNANGVHNLFINTGNNDFNALIKQMHRGLIVTEVMGQGVNLVTGDYSRGISGFWVENGEIQFPVEGVTIAGNLREMFLNLQAVGNDVDPRSHIHTGSLLLAPMTIAGH